MSGKCKEMVVKKSKARRTFNKNPFKFTKKLFEEEKVEFLMNQKKPLKCTYKENIPIC